MIELDDQPQCITRSVLQDILQIQSCTVLSSANLADKLDGDDDGRELEIGCVYATALIGCSCINHYNSSSFSGNVI